jgi:hypothetical protein
VSAPPAKPCLKCTAPELVEPVSAELPEGKRWRFHCASCGDTRYEPAREKDVPGWCDRRGGPAIV